jgi:hypothetical protein
MKTIAAIKNELFQDYLKVVSTDNLEQTLDNPNVPVPFICVAAVQNPNSDKLAAEINKFFEHKKLKNKDFLAMDASDLAQLNFMFNLVQLSTTGESNVVTAPIAAAVAPVAEVVVEEVVAAPVVEKAAKGKEAPVAEVAVETQVEVEVESTPVEVAVETVVEVASVAEEVEAEAVAVTPEAGEIIESLNIPKHSTIHFAKNAEVTATIVDEKTVVFDGEELPIVDATKKAFKKAGTTGMALGLANWNYEGTSLKALKDKN